MSGKALVGSVVLSAVLCTSPALAQKKNRPVKPAAPTATPATTQDYAQLKNVPQLGGTITTIDPASNLLTLRVTIPKLVPNPNYRSPRPTRNYNHRNNNYHRYQRSSQPRRGGGTNPQAQMNNLMRRYQQVLRVRNPFQREREMMQLTMQMQQVEMTAEMQAAMQMQLQAQQLQAQEMQQMARYVQMMAQANRNPNNQPVKVVTSQKDFDLPLETGVDVRKMFVGVEYDDTGNRKEYTKAELAELRGKDTSKPGYRAKLEDVQPGQEVVLYLTAPKKTTAKTSIEALTPPATPPLPTVHRIVMTRELTAAKMPLRKTGS